MADADEPDPRGAAHRGEISSERAAHRRLSVAWGDIQRTSFGRYPAGTELAAPWGGVAGVGGGGGGVGGGVVGGDCREWCAPHESAWDVKCGYVHCVGCAPCFDAPAGADASAEADASTGADAGVGAEAGADAAMAAGALLPGTAPGGEPGGELGGEPALSTAPRSTRGARRVGIGEQGASGDGGDACVACGPGNNCCRC